MKATITETVPALEDPSAADTAAVRAAEAAEAKQLADAQIGELRTRLDQIDQAIIDLWLERAAISREVGKTRVAAGGTRLVLSREQEILDRYRSALGADGTQLALLVLRAGRGKLV